MDKNHIEFTHKSHEDHETFMKSITDYENPTHQWNGNIETRTNSDGSISTTLERGSILDYTCLGQNANLTGAVIEIGTDD